MTDVQQALFDIEEPWKAEWRGMPEFIQEDLSPERSLIVHFESLADVELFAELVRQPIGPFVKSIWYPEADILRLADKGYMDE